MCTLLCVTTEAVVSHLKHSRCFNSGSTGAGIYSSFVNQAIDESVFMASPHLGRQDAGETLDGV